MPSPITPPIIVSAVPEKVYDTWFFLNFQATNLHDAANASLTFERVPQNSETKEILWSGKEVGHGNFWDIVQNVPGAPEVMQDVINILPAIKSYLSQQ